jgi:hypothetical protein
LSGKAGAQGYVNAAVFVAENSAGACRISVVAQEPTGKPPKRDWTGRILQEIRVVQRRLANRCSGVHVSAALQQQPLMAAK